MNRMNFQKIIVVFLMILGAIITGFLIFGAMNSVPLLDDYSWPFSINLGEGYLGAQTLFYEKVNGRILATFISTILMNNVWFYSLYSVSLVFFIVLSSSLLYKIIRKLFDLEGWIAFSLALVLNLFFIANSPQLSTQFFWLTGVLVYQLSFIFALISIVYYLGEIKRKWIYVYLFSAFGVLAFEMVLLLIVPFFFVLEINIHFS